MKDNALYLEADEDITSAIDKLNKAPAGPVQIVVPKRSALLQSIINLKLLKKAGESSGKAIVLVTNDKIAADLAARVGLAVAPAIGAKAILSEAKAAPKASTEDEIIEDSDPSPGPNELAAADAALKPAPKPKRSMPLLRRREVPDVPAAAAVTPIIAGAEPDDVGPSPVAAASGATTPKVPNFKKLQRRLLWLGTAVFLVAGYFIYMYFFTSADVNLYANASKVSIDTTFSVKPGGTTNQAKGELAGQTVTVSKDLSGAVTPSGQKDAGAKATGTVTIYNEYDTSPHTLVAGTRFQAPDGKVFVTTADASVPGATLSLSGGKIGLSPGKSDPVAVEATQNGDSYNEAAAKYSVVAYQGEMQTKIYGQGSQMSGGSSRTVTVVTQPDVDAAVTALVAKDKDNAARDLKGKAPSGYIILNASEETKTSAITPSPAVNAEATTGTVTVKASYTALAVKKTEYESFLRAQELKQIGGKNQIYDDGIAEAQITPQSDDSSDNQTFHFTTEAYSGAKIDTAALASNLAGKRYGDAQDLSSRQPSVSRVEIHLHPAWTGTLPKRASNIHVNIKVADGQ